MRGRDTTDVPEYLRGPLRFYWVDTGNACGLVVVNVDPEVDAIVDCAPYWRRHFVGRTMSEVCDMCPNARIVMLKGDEAPTLRELDAKLGSWKRPRKRC